MNKIIIATLLLFFIQELIAQQTQTIKGTVTDKSDNLPLVGVTVILDGTEPVIGTITNAYGEFELKDIPIGIYTLNFSMLGYRATQKRDLILKSGKQLVVSTVLEEQAVEMEGVEVVAFRKGEVINNFAFVSARSFSVDETERYAGSWGDPARMARNFAGVSAAGDSRNDIIIRGNSPMGLLWRIEGVEVSSPNHFAGSSSTGGPVSILNNNTLQSSDFFLGAFPAEFGNATSGVFDLNMRNGNNEKYEFMGQVGFNGFEAMLEGPFSKKYRGSFLVSYRYSVLEIMNKLGFIVAGGGVPEYQDLTLKLNLPTKKLGIFSVFAIGGISDITYLSEVIGDDADQYDVGSDQNLYYGSDLAIVGASHKYILDENSYLQTGAAFSGSRMNTRIDSVLTSAQSGNEQISPFYGATENQDRLTFSLKYVRKINRKNSIQVGGLFLNQYVKYRDSARVSYTYYDAVAGSLADTIGFVPNTNVAREKVNTLKAYVQWHHSFSNLLEMGIGAFYQQFLFNGKQVIEPRFSLGYNFTANDKIAFGYGLHSKLPPAIYYFLLDKYDENDVLVETSEMTNKNMGPMKAHHFVVGYDKMYTPNLHFKLEAYFQYLFDVPIEKDSSYYSLLNYGSSFASTYKTGLVNQGTGMNYGVDLTLEKYLNKNWYMMYTGSLFDSKYKASDKVLRHTAYATNFINSLLAGYEYDIAKSLSIDVNTTLTYGGGLRSMPIDLEESIQENETVYDEYNAYSKREPDYFRMDLRIALRQSLKKFSQEWGVDFTNITNHGNVFSQIFDRETQSVQYTYQQRFSVMGLYRISF